MGTKLMICLDENAKSHIIKNIKNSFDISKMFNKLVR
jgi:hypothetical protein